MTYEMFEHTKLIDRLIDAFLSSDEPTLGWLREVVRAHAFLPLYVGWVAVLGMRSDGTFVRWDSEGDRGLEPLNDAFWIRVAIFQGVKRFDALRPLLPSRPPGAATCDACHGTGDVPGHPTAVCSCGGAGWLIKGEVRGPSP
jgi:hypothetical protein